MVFRNALLCVQISFLTKFTSQDLGNGGRWLKKTHATTKEAASMAHATHAAQEQTPFWQFSFFNSLNNHDTLVMRYSRNFICLQSWN